MARILGSIALFFCLLIISSTQSCPKGWVDGMDLGCLYYGKESSSWLHASTFCEKLNSSLVEILSDEENQLLSLISTFKLPMTGVDGCWIGLDDIGHESIWQWESSMKVADYFSWADNHPINEIGNMSDCVYMIPDSLQPNHVVWKDYYCDEQASGVKIAPLCQIRENDIFSTTTLETTSTSYYSTTSQQLCPESKDNWSWLPFMGRCYKLITKPTKWNGAYQYCREEGDLVSIHSEAENNFIGSLVEGHDGAHIGGYFNSSNDILENNGAWSDGTSWNYTHWYPDYPQPIAYYNDAYYAYIEKTEFGTRWFSDYEKDREFVCKR